MFMYLCRKSHIEGVFFLTRTQQPQMQKKDMSSKSTVLRPTTCSCKLRTKKNCSVGLHGSMKSSLSQAKSLYINVSAPRILICV